MNKSPYSSVHPGEKCQCITFDAAGSIMGSCDSLFNTSRLTIEVIRKEFPFLWKVISYLRGNDDNSDALFFPHIEFECNGYHSVCDFTFMKSVDALGIKRFICMIYDNSIHYKDLIESECRTAFTVPNLHF